MTEMEKIKKLIDRNKGVYDDKDVFKTVYNGTLIEADSMESLKEKCAMCDMDNDKQFHEKVEDMMKGDDYEYKGI